MEVTGPVVNSSFRISGKSPSTVGQGNMESEGRNDDNTHRQRSSGVLLYSWIQGRRYQTNKHIAEID